MSELLQRATYRASWSSQRRRYELTPRNHTSHFRRRYTRPHLPATWLHCCIRSLYQNAYIQSRRDNNQIKYIISKYYSLFECSIIFQIFILLIINCFYLLYLRRLLTIMRAHSDNNLQQLHSLILPQLILSCCIFFNYFIFDKIFFIS